MAKSATLTVRLDPRDVRIMRKFFELARLIIDSDPVLIPDDVRQCALDAIALRGEEYPRG